jgi:hypothetical protein
MEYSIFSQQMFIFSLEMLATFLFKIYFRRSLMFRCLIERYCVSGSALIGWIRIQEDKTPKNTHNNRKM